MAGEVTKGNDTEKARQYKEALDLCGRIETAAGLVKAWQELGGMVNRAVSEVQRQTFLQTDLPYVLEITLSGGAEAYVDFDDDIVQDQPDTFEATEISSIGQHGVEFYNRHNGHRLHINGYEFEVSPKFLEEAEEQNQV